MIRICSRVHQERRRFSSRIKPEFAALVVQKVKLNARYRAKGMKPKADMCPCIFVQGTKAHPRSTSRGEVALDAGVPIAGGKCAMLQTTNESVSEWTSTRTFYLFSTGHCPTWGAAGKVPLKCRDNEQYSRRKMMLWPHSRFW